MKSFVLSAYRFWSRSLSGYRLTRFGPVAAAKGAVAAYLSRDLEPGVFEIHGYRMYLPAGELGLALTGFSEARVTEYIQSIVTPGMVVLDVGAHVGYYSLMLADLAGPTGRLFAFEPEPANRDILEKNVALNNFTNTTIVGKAVGASGGMLRLHLAPENTGGHTVYPAPGHNRTIEVAVVTIDEYLQSVSADRVDFIKMDIEGYEHRALQGMERTLARATRQRIVMEYSPLMLRRAGSFPSAPLEFVQRLGFRLFEIGASIRPVSIDSLVSRYDGHDISAMVLCER